MLQQGAQAERSASKRSHTHPDAADAQREDDQAAVRAAQRAHDLHERPHQRRLSPRPQRVLPALICQQSEVKFPHTLAKDLSAGEPQSHVAVTSDAILPPPKRPKPMLEPIPSTLTFLCCEP